MNKVSWDKFVKLCHNLSIYKDDFEASLTITNDLIEYWVPTTTENDYNLIEIKKEDNPIIISQENEYQFTTVGGDTVNLKLMFLKPFLVI
jgi:hypothetical protein